MYSIPDKWPLENINEDQLPTEVNSRAPVKIAQSLESNKKELNGTHAIVALTSLLKLQRKPSGENNESHYLEDTCSIINSNLHKFAVSESLEILKIFYKMKMLHSSKISEKIFKHIYASMGDLTFVDICDLAALMRHMPQHRVHTKLKAALPHKFLLKFATDFKENNIDHLDRALSFVSFDLNEKKLLEVLINRLQNYKYDIPLDKTISILASLHNVKHYPEGWLIILQQFEKEMIKNIDQLTDYQVDYIMAIIAARQDRYDRYVNMLMQNNY